MTGRGRSVKLALFELIADAGAVTRFGEVACGR
jgi:hypothetical protein